jgi:hypothetical protein
MVRLTIAAGLLVVALLVFCGLYVFWKGARNVQMAIASVRWPKAAGVVVYSKMSREVTRATRRTKASVLFSTKTVIRYSVDGKDYTTDVLHFGQTLGSDDKSEAALLHLRYPEGKEVTVSYDPQTPSRGVMKPGLHSEAFWLPGAGVAILLPAVLLLIAGPMMIRGLKQDDRAFEKSVERAIETRGREDVPMPPPSSGGDVGMAVAAGVFGAVACALGVLALTAGAQRYWRGSASESWPTAPGVVIFAGSGRGEAEEEAGNDTSDTAYYARIVYEYEVGGAKHVNNMRRFAQVEGGSAAEAEQVAARYRKGAQVKVSYFPTDPDIAVLEPGNTGASLWMPGIGAVLLLFGLACFVWVVPAVAKSIGP